MLFDLHALDAVLLQLLHCGNGVIPVVAQLHDLYAVLLRQREDKTLYKSIVDDLFPAGKARSLLDHAPVVQVFLGGLELHPLLWDKPPGLNADGFTVHRHHGNSGIVVRLRQVNTQPYATATPEGQIFRDCAALHFLYIHIPLSTEAFVEDIAMLAQEVLPLVLIENGRGSQIFDGCKDFFVSNRHGVGLINHQVIRLPVVFDGIVRLV